MNTNKNRPDKNRGGFWIQLGLKRGQIKKNHTDNNENASDCPEGLKSFLIFFVKHGGGK